MEENQVKELLDKVKSEATTVLDQYKKDAVSKSELDAAIKSIKAGLTEAEQKEMAEALDAIKAQAIAIEKLKNRQEVGISASKGFAENFSDAVAEKFDSLKKFSEGNAGAFGMKVVGNMTGAANITPASGIVQTYRSGVALGPDRKIHFRDLVRSVQSATGQYVFYRENTPAGEGAFAFQSTHLNPKAQLDYDYTKVTVSLEYLAGYARVARQMMEDLPWLQTALPDELLRDFYKQEDTEFYTLLAAAATAGVSTATPVAERLVDFMVQVENADYEVNGIALNPTDWGNILKTLPTGGSYSVPGGFQINPSNGQIMFAGVPIYKATWVPADKVLVGDWSRAEIVQSSGLSVRFSEEDQNNFIINAVTAKVEQREGLAILRPNAFVLGDFGLVA